MKEMKMAADDTSLLPLTLPCAAFQREAMGLATDSHNGWVGCQLGLPGWLLGWQQGLPGLLVGCLAGNKGCLVCWLVAWLATRVAWFAGWLLGWQQGLPGLLVGCLAGNKGCLVGWLVGCLAGNKGCLVCWLVAWLAGNKRCLVCWWAFARACNTQSAQMGCPTKKIVSAAPLRQMRFKCSISP